MFEEIGRLKEGTGTCDGRERVTEVSRCFWMKLTLYNVAQDK